MRGLANLFHLLRLGQNRTSMPIEIDEPKLDILTDIETSLVDSFPDNLYVLHHPRTGVYGCYCHGGLHGLACFTSEMSAFRFAEHIELSGMASQETTFDEAREIARSRPAPLVALLLLDSLSNPKIHYIK